MLDKPLNQIREALFLHVSEKLLGASGIRPGDGAPKVWYAVREGRWSCQLNEHLQSYINYSIWQTCFQTLSYIYSTLYTNIFNQICTRCTLGDQSGLVNGLVSGLNQLLSRARFDGVWIGHNDKEVARFGFIGIIPLWMGKM